MPATSAASIARPETPSGSLATLASSGPGVLQLGLPRFDGQGWWLGQATWVRASWRLAVSNSSGVM